jgi:two-component sensor histidine kinase
VALLERSAVERAELAAADHAALNAIVREWEMIADLALSDLVLWLPTWNEAGFVAAAHVRPTTAATAVPEQIGGTFVARGRMPHVDRALQHGRPTVQRDGESTNLPVGFEGYPVLVDSHVVAVVERRPSAAVRVAGRLEDEYLTIADQLLTLLAHASYPPIDVVQRATGTARVGDGLIRLDAQGRIGYASPNAVSALRRLGWPGDVEGEPFRDIVQRAVGRHGTADEELARLVAGSIAGRADIERADVTMLMRVVPLPEGAVVLIRDVTETRRRDRALLTKDATIREIHHRVKNNLQTVAALLRLQGRRATGDEAKNALAEAQVRIGAIAVVHDLLAAGGAAEVPFAEVVDRIIALVRDLAPAFGTTVQIRRDGECGSLPAEMSTPLAMATAELLQNAIEHAQATHIDVHLAQLDGQVRIEVRDDGVGIDPSSAGNGLGLSIVESLVTGELRGTFTLEPMEHGTRACVDVPVA